MKPGRTATFQEINRGNYLFSTTIDETTAHALPLGETQRERVLSIRFPALVRSAICHAEMCFGLIPIRVLCSVVTITNHSPVKRECGDIY